MVVAGLSTGALVVFALIFVALVLFVSEVIPNDVTAIGIVVSLAVLEPVTGIDTRAAISGFANPATITIVAMYMLSAGIQGTGLVQRLGLHLIRVTKGSERRSLVATVCTTGPLAGFVNNTPIVAVFIPMISDLADKNGISPSKLLLPLSFAAILGGTLTLIGTSTNLLASEFAVDLLEREPIGMFEFTALGVVILIVGVTYLLTVGRWLTPARIPPNADPTEAFDLEDHLARVVVREGSTAVGHTVEEFEALLDEAGGEAGNEIRILQLVRDGEERRGRRGPVPIQPGDELVVHGTRQSVNRFRENHDLRLLPRAEITAGSFEGAASEETLATAVVPPESPFVNGRLEESRLTEWHDTTVLAVRRKDELIRTGVADLVLRPGDTLLVLTTADALRYFTTSGDLIVMDEGDVSQLSTQDIADLAPLDGRTPIAVASLVGVVGLAALDVLPIVIAALAGVFVMIVTRTLTPADAYDAVSWNIIFLLAGVIPLGLAMEQTGGAAFLAEALIGSADVLPLLLVLLLFYLLTGLFANLITPVATVVLMAPVAVGAAAEIGANEFAFLLAVMFSSATSFMTPIGYQTNLMVYGPGGYRFSDFLRVGAPLQLLLAVVTTVGIAHIWGL